MHGGWNARARLSLAYMHVGTSIRSSMLHVHTGYLFDGGRLHTIPKLVLILGIYTVVCDIDDLPEMYRARYHAAA